MSKRLEELGISPAPWFVGKKEDGYFFAMVTCVTPDGKKIVASTNSNFDCHKADDNIIAAAPELYDAGQKTEAVLDKLFGLDEFAALLKSGAADALIACRDKLRDALAKASGEAAK